jgi:hypothetical protein
LTNLSQQINPTTIVSGRSRASKKTQYMPAVTEELANVSKYDSRSEDTVVSKKSSHTTDPRLRAAIDAVSLAVELSAKAQALVEGVNHVAKSMMDKHNIEPKGTFSDPDANPFDLESDDK